MNGSTKTRLFSTGTIIDGKWILMECIGKGAMGEVYRAHQLNLKRDVAIKIVSREFLESLQDDPAEVERASQRLQREVETMAQVRHPNVLQIFDFGEFTVTQDNTVHPMQYIVMEYVPGNTLRFTMSEEGFGEDEGLFRDWIHRYFFPVLDAMESVHEKGIIHRDMKPENVLMDQETPKIADFGLARSIRMRAISDSWDVKGTIHYMAPEQFVDFRKVGPAADIYALGKILFEVVEGKIPPTTVPLKSSALTDPKRPFFQKVDAIIQKATAENPAERFQDIAELRTALLDVMKHDTPDPGKEKATTLSSRSRPWMMFTAAAAVLAVTAMALWHWMGNPAAFFTARKAPPTEKTISVTAGSPAPEIRAKDGMAMVLIKGKEASIDDVPLQEAFYMDREKVSLHHFAEFLNQVKDTLTVEKGRVLQDGKILLYMGTGTEPHEQIYFEHGRFHLRDPAFAGRPVVRVTYAGALAYAAYYGKRLPTTAQWRQAVAWLHSQVPDFSAASETQGASPMPAGHMHMMDVSSKDTGTSAAPVPSRTDLPLEDPGIRIKEWAMEGGAPATPDLVPVISWETLISDETPKSRYRSEGFPDVGFRTVIPVVFTKARRPPAGMRD
ncbi:MAG: serine/threonine protein kinase [Deltaproteobacteria bacterium]|nr:serine/threonine protein kinase [Deltaproteobacteria bacterium]MBW2040964.1 serine/threonine protein kinase [Deltaproteobacteria bacterium]